MAYEVKKTEHNGAKKVKVFGVRKLMRKNKAIKTRREQLKKRNRQTRLFPLPRPLTTIPLS